MEGAGVSFVFITDSFGNTVYKKNIDDQKKNVFTELLTKAIIFRRF